GRDRSEPRPASMGAAERLDERGGRGLAVGVPVAGYEDEICAVECVDAVLDVIREAVAARDEAGLHPAHVDRVRHAAARGEALRGNAAVEGLRSLEHHDRAPPHAPSAYRRCAPSLSVLWLAVRGADRGARTASAL